MSETPALSPLNLSVRAALARGVSRFEAASVPSAPLAAELLLMHLLGRDRAWLYAHSESPLTPEQSAAYAQLLDRRAAGTPVQHLTGHQEFWGLEFEVTPDVLIPRPETEHIIEVALDRLKSRRDEALTIADIGTGSGCLAVTLAREFPNARVIATDISAAALQVASRNAARHGLASRIDFAQANLLDRKILRSPGTLAPGTAPAAVVPDTPRFDLIVSNPPYIGTRDAATLPREVRDYEPPQALFAGEHGFDLYAPLIAQAAAHLRPGGLLILELGYNGADHVRALLEKGSSAWRDIIITPDLAGIPRVISAICTL